MTHQSLPVVPCSFLTKLRCDQHAPPFSFFLTPVLLSRFSSKPFSRAGFRKTRQGLELWSLRDAAMRGIFFLYRVSCF